jgi:hypothetical protein
VLRARLVPFLVLLPLGSAGPPAPVGYTAPVTAPIVDGFRPPASPYGPGNRGLEYRTAPGDPVRAAAAGVVTFAGAVAGARYVTVLHADRVRTTYGGLRTVGVAAGEQVAAGQVIGEAGGGLLWTARLGRDAYLDPAILLAASGHGQVHLVPAPGPTSRPGGRAHPAPRSPVSRAAAAWALE